MSLLRINGYIAIFFGFGLSIVSIVDGFVRLNGAPIPLGMPIVISMLGMIALAIDDVLGKFKP